MFFFCENASFYLGHIDKPVVFEPFIVKSDMDFIFLCYYLIKFLVPNVLLLDVSRHYYSVY